MGEQKEINIPGHLEMVKPPTLELPDDQYEQQLMAALDTQRDLLAARGVLLSDDLLALSKEELLTRGAMLTILVRIRTQTGWME